MDIRFKKKVQRQHSVESIVSLKNGLKILATQEQKSELGSISHLLYRKHLRMNHRPECKTYNYKLTEKENLQPGIRQGFFTMTSKAWPIEQSIDQLNVMKIKTSSCIFKGMNM